MRFDNPMCRTRYPDNKQCPVLGCPLVGKPFMCWRHWMRVPAKLRKRITITARMLDTKEFEFPAAREATDLVSLKDMTD